jgi:hypothetical protein
VRQRNNHIRHRRIHAVDTDSAGKGFIDFQHVRPQFSSQESELLPVPKSSIASCTP